MAKTAAQKQADYRKRLASDDKVQLNVFVARDLATLAASKCFDAGMTMSGLVSCALEAYIKPKAK